VCAFLLSLGFQLIHKATCRGGGCLTRHSHYVRLRMRGITIWRIQCTTCRAVFTVLPHFVLRYRSMRPEVARDALLATHGGLSLELCAVLYHISPMALYRLICALGHHSLVAVLTRCGLPLPPYFLADEKHTHCLTTKAYLPTIVSGRVLWHLGYTEEASAVALAQSYGEFQEIPTLCSRGCGHCCQPSLDSSCAGLFDRYTPAAGPRVSARSYSVSQRDRRRRRSWHAL
jgi:hypothetical protein